jgi:hypothetical protein
VGFRKLTSTVPATRRPATSTWTSRRWLTSAARSGRRWGASGAMGLTGRYWLNL